eukprot:331306-Rhodomonas_salina.2
MPRKWFAPHSAVLSTANNISRKDYGLELVVCIAVFCYINGFAGNFTYDDTFAITNNQDVVGPGWKLPGMFVHDFWGQDISMHPPSPYASCASHLPSLSLPAPIVLFYSARILPLKYAVLAPNLGSRLTGVLA